MKIPRGPSGKYVGSTTTGADLQAFVPNPLPPADLDLSRIEGLLESASESIGRLDGLASVLPEPSFFVYLYVRKEAVLSSQIEGTQSSLSDLLLFEGDEGLESTPEDAEEVSNYVAALQHGIERMRDGFPLALRLLREMHQVLLRSGRGSERNPGEFRAIQNWIGGTRPQEAKFVPPPPQNLSDCVGDLERFLHQGSDKLPKLVAAALAHVQFETIHPFLDGNGRLGRLLVTLFLTQSGMLHEPLLYLSLHFKRHRDEYYQRLNGVRTHGQWEEWIASFLEAVRETSEQASFTARELLRIVKEDTENIKTLGRRAASALRVRAWLQQRPVSSVPAMVGGTGLSGPATRQAVEALQQLGMVREISGRRRNRIYTYERYLRLLNEGTEAPRYPDRSPAI